MIHAKKRKHAVFLTMFFLTAAFLCACSATEKASWYSKSAESADAYEISSGDATNIEDVTLFHSAFTMGNSLFYLGDCTVQDLLSAGAVAYAEDNEDVTETGDASETQKIILYYNGENFSIVAENRDADGSAVNGYTVATVYFTGTNFKAPGGLGIGDSLSDFNEAYGTPFEAVSGDDVSENYEGITAYYYVSEYSAYVVCVFVDDDTEEALSVRIGESTDYITDITEFGADRINQLCEEYLNSTLSSVSPEIYEVNETSSIEGTVSDIEFFKATLYTLDEIDDLENYDLGTGELLDSTPNILFVAEYRQTVSYSKDDRTQASITDGITLDASYDAYGCFFIIDPCWADGEIESAVTEELMHSTGMLFLDEDTMLEQIFYASDRGYGIDKYTATSRTSW